MAHLEGHSVALISPEVWQRDGDRLTALFQRIESELAPGSWLIPTGGSSGEQRLAVHSSLNLTTAANAYWQHFRNGKVNALISLPLWHVSGLMAWMRAVVAGGDVVFSDYKDWLSGKFPDIDCRTFRLSLVPTQLSRLIEDPDVLNWLRALDCIHLGGAAAGQALLQRARDEGLRLSPCYGMTETAAMVTAMSPEDFLRGQAGCGQALPGVVVRVADKEAGRIYIECPWMCEKLLPEGDSPRYGVWGTGDRGHWGEGGSLIIDGRIDRIIISGGEKVPPEPMEALLRTRPEIADVLIWGEKNPDWGQQVVALIAATTPLDEQTVRQLLDQEFPSHWLPKKFYWHSEVPRTEAGKPDWLRIQALQNPASAGDG